MKRNTLTTAVLAGLTGVAGMASVANAVNVNPDGLGQVLLYPYYSARGGNDTYISIVNTSDRAKAVKIRFIEALNSREVLDFNIYMSAYDVWAAGITQNEAGGGKIAFSDTTCTAPYLLESQGGEVDFSTLVLNDGGPDGPDRTLSGYVEVLEMGNLTGAAAAAATHTSAGVPPVSGTTEQRTCGALLERWIGAGFANGTGEWIADDEFELEAPTGGLFGAGAIINVAKGTMFGYNATAIDGFWEDGVIAHTEPRSLFPSLQEGDTQSTVFVNGAVSNETWSTGTDAMNHVLAYEKLMNEYMVIDDVDGATEWVVTFPTKRFHTDASTSGAYVPAGSPESPFTTTWTDDFPYSCEEVDLRVWDREEQTPGADTGGIGISPSETPEDDVFELCREANVIRFANDGSLPDMAEISGEPSPEVTAFSQHGYINFDLPSSFEAGWAQFDFSNRFSNPSLSSGNSAVGLPAIGFAAQTYTNGFLEGGVLANYGASFDHHGSRVLPTSAD
ncbi:MAG: hypothetical protein U5L08_12540 [Xanthomonadales bacterium]|nr:hypothetical protein [Xanthomonadales bacterium]